MFRATEGRWGSREIEIVDVALVGADGERAHVFHSGERLDVRLRLRAPVAMHDFVFGVGLFNAEGICCYGTNTDIEELKADASSATPRSMFSIEASISSKAPTNSTSRSTRSTATRTTITACSIPFA